MDKSLPAIFADSLAALSGEDFEKARQVAIDVLSEFPESLPEFERAYKAALAAKNDVGNRAEIPPKPEGIPLHERIVKELLGQTKWLEWDGERLTRGEFPKQEQIVTLEETRELPEEERPQLTGYMSKRDMGEHPSWPLLLDYYVMHKRHPEERVRKLAWHRFRQGIDLLDMDACLYKMLGLNVNSMSKWLPALCEAKGDFFKIPKTRVCLVPVDIMQMSRLGYETLRPATLKIIDDWAYQAFNLKDDGDYFIKTGVHSSKFDFRNARVHDPKEVRELGEYLLYIQSKATELAGPLNNPVIYGVSTTNEWVVREFIEDVENNPAIYHGMPLHTEYRAFIDFDRDEIMGVFPYWEPNVMKNRLGMRSDAREPSMAHDFVIYSAHEKRLMERFHETLPLVTEELSKIVPAIDLPGQWSLDVMRNGRDFWLIDMAQAHTSALRELLPQGAVKEVAENWIPLE